MKIARKVISSTMLFIVVMIIVSAYWIFFKERTTSMTTLHISAGVFFLVSSSWHIYLNRKALFHYVRFQLISLLPASILALGLMIGVFSWMSPFSQLLNFGGNARFQDKDLTQMYTPLKEGEIRLLQVDILNTHKQGVAINLGAEVGPSYSHDMVMLLWVEDIQGRYLETIYSTRRFAKGLMTDPDNRSENIYRQESVPHWIGKRQQALKLDNLIPDSENELPDAISGATPRSHFLIKTKLSDPTLRKFILKFEANQSYDWNEYYSKDRFLDDAVYSGTGQVGQPSIIYQVEIDLDHPKEVYFLMPAGHGHHSGQNAEIDSDMSNVTTALWDFYRLIIEVEDIK
ncbi:DUF4405 domain-containing protein [Marinicellulosiphila megalodicopiae]|uniref:DUF4405 domain-containing protein n=1 Tax=Marinicellulosiphila megalodicopiae TaxID=2724896 RepID=UPI003BB04B0A